MGSSRFALFALIRVLALGATLVALAILIVRTEWIATMLVVVAIASLQWIDLLRFVNTSNREIGRFLNAIEYEDLTQNFSDRGLGGTFRELGRGLNRVMESLRASRIEREEQAHYLRTLVEHIPVALIAIEKGGETALLNSAARRLMGTGRFAAESDLGRGGAAFAEAIARLRSGETATVRLERPQGTIQLKAAATQVTAGGRTQRLISLQSIETELNAQELSAWQALIRVLTHEMMNSLTPVSSLSRTAHGLVAELHDALPADSDLKMSAEDARDALEAVARRSEGLSHFIQSYRRLTRDFTPRIEAVPAERIFARLMRLMGPDLLARGIALETEVEPPTLELPVDAELLDQALINLVRNAADALEGCADAHVVLRARLEAGGVVALSVADNGPGIASEIRDKVYVPFYTTKRTGSGVGLSLTRQIVLAHGGTIELGDTPGGGATITLRFR